MNCRKVSVVLGFGREIVQVVSLSHHPTWTRRAGRFAFLVLPLTRSAAVVSRVRIRCQLVRKALVCLHGHSHPVIWEKQT